MYKVLILSLHIVELEKDVKIKHNCWSTAHIPRVNKIMCGILYVYISESKYLMTVTTSLISYCSYLDFFCRDLVKRILEN